MRFLINKLDIPAEFRKQYSEKEYEVRSVAIAWRCKNCGADLYGEFRYPVSSSLQSISEMKRSIEHLEWLGDRCNAGERKKLAG